MSLYGSIVALITPIYNDKVDCKALQDLVKWHSEQGTDAIVVVGSTGSGGLLSEEERREAICTVVQKNNSLSKKMKIIAGCGTLSTKETIKMVKNAEQYGADAIMVVSPCYVKPTQEGAFQHFKSISENTQLPLILYNHPGRTGINLHNETLIRLCNSIPHIVAIKDSNPDLSRIAELRIELPENVSLLSGDDATNIGFLAQGGSGIISVTANVFPSLCKKFIQAWQNNDRNQAFEIHKKLMPVHRAMFCEPNPVPVVYAVSKIKKIYNEVRMPLIPIQNNTSSAHLIDCALQSLTSHLN